MNKEIMSLAIPNIISNISIPLLSSVDTALMGHLSSKHIGAVGLGAMIFNFIYWNFGFLRMGTTGFTAQNYGKQNDDAIIHTLVRAIIVALILAVFILLLQLPLAKASIWLMNIGDDSSELVWRYFSIRIWAAPATLLLYSLLGWYFGMQNAIYPLIVTICVNIVNIIASIYFVNYLEWDVDGVAWGTVLAQYIGLAIAIMLFAIKYRYLLAHISQKVITNTSDFASFLGLNRDIFIRTFCLTFAFFY